MDVQPKFDIDNFALYDIRVVGNHQRTTAEERLANRSVVEITICFRQAGVSWSELFGHKSCGDYERTHINCAR